MKSFRNIFVGLLLVTVLGSVCCNSRRTGAETGESIATKVSGAANLLELEHIEVTTGGAAANEVLPMIIAVHGLGDNPENFKHLFDGFSRKARVVLPRAPISDFRGPSWFDIELPFKGDGESLAPGIARATDSVIKLISDLSHSRPTSGKPVICGFSQGGAVSFAALGRRPDLFRGAVPLSGAVPRSLVSKQGDAQKPVIRAAHGAQDPLIPLDAAKQSTAALKAAGYDATLTVFSGLGHSIDRRMRDFLFEQLIELLDDKNN